MRLLLAFIVAFGAMGCGDNEPPPAPQGFIGINPWLPGSGGGGAGGGAGTVTNVSSTAANGITITNPTTTPLIDVDTSVIQKRVTSTCSAGNWLTAIAANGTATCTAGAVTAATTPLEVSGSTVLVTTTGAKEGYGLVYNSGWGVGAPQTAYKTDVLIEDEFLNGGISNDFYTFGTAGAGAGCATNGVGVAAATHPGINACSSGSTSTGRSSALSGTSGVQFSGGAWTFDTIVGVSALSSGTEGYAVQVGFIDVTASVSQVDGCYFEYDERNAAGHNASNLQKWIAVCASNSVRTAFILDGSSTCEGGFGTSINQAVSALTLPDTNWTKLKVVVNAAGTQADFYVGDVASCRITTNIPTTAARSTAIGWLFLKSIGATAVLFDLDWLRVKVALTSARL